MLVALTVSTGNGRSTGKGGSTGNGGVFKLILVILVTYTVILVVILIRHLMLVKGYRK